VKGCPQSGEPIEFDEDGILKSVKQNSRCDDCFLCADICPPRAIKVWGEYMSVPALMKIIAEDRSFYQKTGGGVTLSGGEVMVQWEFARLLLEACKKASIHTCVETALHCPWENASAVFDYADLVIADIKHMDTKKHREYTGAGNELILENLIKTVGLGKKLVLRTPVVPRYNSDDENIRATAEFIRDKLGGKIVAWQLLPYRKMGTEKYDSLGDAYPMGDYVPPERSEWEQNLLRIEALVRDEYGIPAVAGSSAKLEV
jgi:pyruvate formate lyase activating enzyme